MRKQDFVPPIFADGPSISDPGFAKWLAAQQEVKLPFTIWRRPRVAAIGRHTDKPKETVRITDYKLGIPLDERMRMLCKDEDPCVIWLSGSFGDVIPGETASKDVFGVSAVHEVVDPKATLHAQSVRGPACLAIRALKPLHCARGPLRCEKCKAVEKEPAKPKLLDVCPYGDYARPTIDTASAKGRVYDVLQTFESADEAKGFAEKHLITDVVL